METHSHRRSRRIGRGLAGIMAVGLAGCMGQPEEPEETGSAGEELTLVVPSLPLTLALFRAPTPAENGVDTQASLNCSDGHSDAVNVMCAIPGVSCSNTTPTCRTHSRQIFTGARKWAASPTWSYWNYLGGGGELAANATLCTLQDLANHDALRVVALGTLPGLGTLFAAQTVGFTSWDPGTATMRGYRQLRVSIPVFGALDVAVQPFTAVRRMRSPVVPFGATAGTVLLDASYAIEFTTEQVDRSFTANFPPFTVPTPFGNLSAQPSFTYETNSNVVMPEASTYTAVGEMFVDRRTFHTDLYGQVPGVTLIRDAWSFSDTGWDSMIGLGGRGLPGSSVWTASGSFAVRPDTDLTAPRSSSENAPGLNLGASARIVYSTPLDVLPEWARGIATLSIWMAPKLSTATTGQLHILEREGRVWPTDIGGSALNAQTVTISDQLAINASFTASAGLDLEISPGFPFPTISAHPSVTVLELNSSPTRAGSRTTPTVRIQSTRTGTAYASALRRMQPASTSADSTATATTFVQACFASTPAARPVPTPTFTPGDPSGLFDNELYPCNICLIDPRSSATPVTYLYPSSDARGGSQPWTCDQVAKNGCHDLCRWTPGGSMTVAQSASTLPFGGPGEFAIACNAPRPPR